MRGLLTTEDWTPEEWAVLQETAADVRDGALTTRALVLLCWLSHVENNLTKSERYMRSPLWIHRNVESVLVVAAS